MFKKIGCFAVALILLLSFAACDLGSLDTYKNTTKLSLDSYAQKAKEDCGGEFLQEIDDIVAQYKKMIDEAQSKTDASSALDKAKKAIDALKPDEPEPPMTYDKEVILLVDLSFSNRASEEEKNGFVKSVIDACPSKYAVGVVTFGKTQVYAAELNSKTDGLYQRYVSAPRPEDGATDIASALLYASGLFKKPKNGKIVLITDGVETDGAAMSVIMAIAAKGIKVDTVHFPDEQAADAQIIGMEFPDYNITAGEAVKIGVTVQSSFSGLAKITLYDNDAINSSMFVSLHQGLETFFMDYTFSMRGRHDIRAEITTDDDTVKQNNVYYSYAYLETFDKVLILDGGNESSRLADIIKDEYQATVMNIKDAPSTLSELREYDEVILMNVANADMPQDFDELLYTYVRDYGGGLLTVGGNKVEGGEQVPNTYNKADMNPNGVSSLYQQMLPVECIDYTPPVAIMLVIDRSGSMQQIDSQSGKTRMELAKEGAKAAVDTLSERDYVGVVSFDSMARLEIGLTPLTQKAKILNAISGIEAEGGTVYSEAIQMAGNALKALTGVEKKHIIFITDGEPSDKVPLYAPMIESNVQNGITMSVVAIINSGMANEAIAQEMAERGDGRAYFVRDVVTLPQVMREEIKDPLITSYVPAPFTPILNYTPIRIGVYHDEIPELCGYYGVKAKPGMVEISLTGPYGVPIYAQWKFGKGRVGSFMCDLNGTWSDDFLNDVVGQRLIKNMIKSVLPTENIRAMDIEAEIEMLNYTALLIISTQLSQGDTVEVTITGPSNNPTTVTAMLSDNALTVLPDNFAFCGIDFSQPGIYKIVIRKKNSSGNVVSEITTYTVFSYSAEYNTFVDQEEALAFLAVLAQMSNGAVITTAAEVFR